jgi:hypothetical protein
MCYIYVRESLLYLRLAFNLAGPYHPLTAIWNGEIRRRLRRQPFALDEVRNPIPRQPRLFGGHPVGDQSENGHDTHDHGSICVYVRQYL